MLLLNLYSEALRNPMSRELVYLAEVGGRIVSVQGFVNSGDQRLGKYFLHWAIQ